MSTINITFSCDNDAFSDDPTPEVVRVLTSVRNRVEDELLDGHRKFEHSIWDINGNQIGKVEVTL